jgi:hypothetical protein
VSTRTRGSGVPGDLSEAGRTAIAEGRRAVQSGSGVPGDLSEAGRKAIAEDKDTSAPARRRALSQARKGTDLAAHNKQLAEQTAEMLGSAAPVVPGGLDSIKINVLNEAMRRAIDKLSGKQIIGADLDLPDAEGSPEQLPAKTMATLMALAAFTDRMDDPAFQFDPAELAASDRGIATAISLVSTMAASDDVMDQIRRGLPEPEAQVAEAAPTPPDLDALIR